MSQQGTLSDSIRPAIGTLTGDVGGAIGPDGALNVDLLGGIGLTTIGIPASNQTVFNVTGSGLIWTKVTVRDINMQPNHGYIPTFATARSRLVLPFSSSVGDVIEICGESPAGWRIEQPGGQYIQYGIFSSTPGALGTLASRTPDAAVKIVCKIALTLWQVVNSIGIIRVT